MQFNRKYIFVLFISMNTFSMGLFAKIHYNSIDKNDPINFQGTYVMYNQDTITLGPRALFIDGQLADSVVAQYPFVFNSINKAALQLTDGDENNPMVLYIAPYVYWIDNPDDPEIRMPENGSGPYGLKIACEWLRFYGLNQDPSNVVLACNRGQTMGSKGNFTMMRILGQGTSAENITFGNYCNVDLTFPLKPSLERRKRGEAIVQAQLVHCNGDKVFIKNSRFISRLNSNPFIGAKRQLFIDCHFECTDDALAGTAVYLNSSFDFYSSKPFYHTTGTGVVFLNCDINSLNSGNQYFTKANGQLAIIDTRIISENEKYVSWRDFPPLGMRNYQSNVTLNGQALFIGKNNGYATVEIDRKNLLNAYRFEYNGKIYYNTYNLLSGNDRWDPLGIKEIVHKAEQVQEKKLYHLPVQLKIVSDKHILETNVDSTFLNIEAYHFGNYRSDIDKVKWIIAPEYKKMIKLEESSDGSGCFIVPTNNTEKAVTVVVEAVSSLGLKAAKEFLIKPKIQEAPQLTGTKIQLDKNEGALKVSYQLHTSYKDETEISWFRCTDKTGTDAIEIAVSRFGHPNNEYLLCMADVGYYIMATIKPKHICSYLGEKETVVYPKPVSRKNILTDNKIITTDFRILSTADQPKILPGFWTFDHIDPINVGSQHRYHKDRDAWYVGKGSGGSVNDTGLLQNGRSALMFYTPIGEVFGDMTCKLKVIPFKTAGQGFSVAPLYMDVLIKFDNKSRSGYGLRIIRTTNYSNAVESYFVKYENGKASQISPSVATSAYRPNCIIEIQAKGTLLNAYIYKEGEQKVGNNPDILPEVNIETHIEPSTNGGFGILYNGGSSAMIRKVNLEWK